VVGTVTEANYTGSATGTLEIGKGLATVTLTGLSQPYDGSGKAVTATTTPAGLTVELTYDGSATPPVQAGNYVVAGTVTDANYTGSATGILIIAKAIQFITFAALPEKIYGDAPFPLTATASSGLPVSYSSDNHGVASVSGNLATIVGVGIAEIIAAQDGDSNYLAAVTVPQSLTVNEPPLQRLVIFDPPRFDPPGTLCLRFTGGTNATYTIETCEKLGGDWSDLGTPRKVDGQPGVYCLEDASAVEHPSRLYRVRAVYDERD
jgi:hypothetical protein